MTGPTTFTGTDDNGDPFVIFYTSTGVRWLRGPLAEPYVARRRPDDPTPHSAKRSSVTNHVGTVAQLVEATAAVGNWWEARQYRLLDSAQFEEERRIPWTSDMMARWVAAHAGGGLLDLRVSGFLARETAATLSAVADNKKMAIPQSLLYDLELIRDAVAGGRHVLLAQFEALDASRHEHGVHLDMAFVRRLAEDPLEEWTRRVVGRTTERFDNDLRDALGSREQFLYLLFGESPAADRNHPKPKGLAGIVNRFAMIPEWPKALADLNRDAAVIRQDNFRELALFSAEVSRSVALHSAWGVVDAIVREQIGSAVVAVEVDGKMSLTTDARRGLNPKIEASVHTPAALGP